MSIIDFLNSEEAKKFEKALEKISTFMNDEDVRTFFREYEKFMEESEQKKTQQAKESKKIKKKLIELNSDYTMEEIKDAFQKLNPRYQGILKRAYGENLDQPRSNENLTTEEKDLLRNAQTALKTKLRNPNLQSKKQKLIELIPDYTLEEIKTAFQRLNPAYQEVLKRAYGENLDMILPRDDFTPKDRNMLGHARIFLEKYLKSPNQKVINQKLIELNSDYTMEEIKDAFQKLNPRYQGILKRAYGENLDQPKSKENFTQEEKVLLNGAQTALKTKLRNPNKKTINQKLTALIPDYTMEEIKAAFQKLNPRYQEILKRAYGENLDQPRSNENLTTEEKGLLRNAQIRLKEKLRNPNQKTRNQKLEVLIPDYTMEEIKDAFQKLNPRYQGILKRAYGENLDQPRSNENLTTEEKDLLRNAQRRLKEKLRNPNTQINKKLIELNSEYTLDDIKAAFQKLNSRYQEILKRMYGENLDQPKSKENLTTEENDLLRSAQTSLKTKLRNPNTQINKKLIELNPEYTLDDIKDAFRKLNPKCQEILKRVYGENLDQPRSKENFTKEERKLLNNAQTILKTKLRNPNPQPRKMRTNKKHATKNAFEKSNGKTITSLFPGYSIEQIQITCASLNPKYQEILKKVYGPKLDKPLFMESLTKDEKKTFYIARDFLGRKLSETQEKQNYSKKTSVRKNQTERLSKENKNLYEIFAQYTKEEIDMAVKFLLEEERDIILIFFGGNYNSPSSYSYLSSGRRQKLDKALEKLNKSLKQLISERTSNLPTNVVKTEDGLYKVDKFNLISFFEQHKYTKVQIAYFYVSLENNQKQLIMKVCGPTLDESDGFVLLDSDDLQTFKNALNTLKKLLLDNLKAKKPIEKKVRLTSIYERFSDYEKEKVDFVISKLDSKIASRFKSFYNDELDKENIIYVSQVDYEFLCRVFGMIERQLKKQVNDRRHVTKKQNTAMIMNGKDRKKIIMPPRGELLSFEARVNLPFGEAFRLAQELNDQDRKTLELAYGVNYTEKLNCELTEAQLIRLQEVFIHMKYLYSQKHKPTTSSVSNKTLFEYLDVDQLSAVDLAYQVLDTPEIELLKIAFGEKLSNKRDNSILVTYETMIVNKIISFLKEELEKQKMSELGNEYKLIHRF